MNKREVAEALNVSTRVVERYDKDGRLGVKTYVRGKTGKQADWKAADVERLRVELEAVDYPTNALEATNSQRAGLVVPEERERLIAALEAISSQRDSHRAPSFTDLAAKPLLTLQEAQTLSGLSRGTLRAAIDAKKLKAQIIGRAWRVKNKDLQAYIDKL